MNPEADNSRVDFCNEIFKKHASEGIIPLIGEVSK